MLEMRVEPHVYLHVKYPLYLSNFNQNWKVAIFPIQNFTKISSTDLELLLA
jgi:hypothetical protein